MIDTLYLRILFEVILLTILEVNNSFYEKFQYNVSNAISALEKEFGQQFSTSNSVREQHTTTTTVHEREIPDGVVFASIKKMSRKLLKFVMSTAVQ